MNYNNVILRGKDVTGVPDRYRNILSYCLQNIIILLCISFGTGISIAQTSAPPPKKVWISLAYSSLDMQAPSWPWLRKQCSKGHIIKSLKPVLNHVSGIIIPVFDNGQCFYETEVPTFKGRTPNSITDERALRELVMAAKNAKVPVYFGIDVLAWQTNNLKETNSNIFSGSPDLQAVSKEDTRANTPAALYASPFSNKTQTIMTALLKELAGKFPKVSGIALNMHLSRQEMLGFSDAARVASIKDLLIDPIDLEPAENDDVRRWHKWRQSKITDFLSSLVNVYKSNKADAQVLISGTAGYYDQRNRSSLSSGQDWMTWAKTGLTNSILLEGHWLPRSNDIDNYNGEVSQVDKLKNDHGDVQIIPVSNGSHLVMDTNYQRDWSALKAQNAKLNQIMLVVRNDDDVSQAIATASGDVKLPPIQMPMVGGIMQDWSLHDAQGKVWSSEYLLQKSPYVMLVGDNATLLGAATKTISAQMPHSDAKLFVISPQPISANNRHGFINLIDVKREFSWFSNSPAVLVVDKAGFVRKTKVLDNPSAATLTLKSFKRPMPALSIGKLAPDFIAKDIDGKTIKLSNFIGKKYVLLTFFPRSFTCSCTQQITSLAQNQSDFADNDMEVIAVSVELADVQTAFAKSLGVKFPLIPDTLRNICILYGAINNNTGLASPESIVIDKKGIVRIIDRDVHTETHASDILTKMREIGLIKQQT